MSENAVVKVGSVIFVRLNDNNAVFAGEHDGRQWVGECSLLYCMVNGSYNIRLCANYQGILDRFNDDCETTGLAHKQAMCALRDQIRSMDGFDFASVAVKFSRANKDHKWVCLPYELVCT